MTEGLVITRAAADEAHQLQTAIQQHLIQAEHAFLQAGRGLRHLLDSGLYQALGYTDFHEFAYSGSLQIKGHQVYRLIRVARRTADLIQRAQLHPEILATVAHGEAVTPASAARLAERAVLGMGIAKADRVLGHVVQATTPAQAGEWLDKGAELREVDLELEIARARRGGAQNPLYDFLVQQRQLGMGLCGELPSLAVPEATRKLTAIQHWTQDALTWLDAYSTEEHHRERGDA